MKPRTALSVILAVFLLASCAAFSADRRPPAGGRRTAATARHERLTPTQDRGTGLYGYLNDFGRWVIRPAYRMAWEFDNAGIACVRTDTGYGAIDLRGRVVVRPVFTEWSAVCAAVRSLSSGRRPGVELWFQRDRATGLCGFLDSRGEWFIAPQYTGGYDFNQRGFAVVEVSRGQWGAIDRRNRFVIQPNFSNSRDTEAALRRITGR